MEIASLHKEIILEEEEEEVRKRLSFSMRLSCSSVIACQEKSPNSKRSWKSCKRAFANSRKHQGKRGAIFTVGQEVVDATVGGVAAADRVAGGGWHPPSPLQWRNTCR